MRPRNAPQPANSLETLRTHAAIGDRWTDGHRRFHESMGDKKELATLDTEELEKLVDERVAAKVKELEARLLLGEKRLDETEAELIKIRATSEGGSSLTKKLQKAYESKERLEKLLSDDERRGSSRS